MDNQPIDQMAIHLQQHVLALLLFDEKHAKLICESLPIEAWATDPALTLLIKNTYEYIHLYGAPPGQAHTFDLIQKMHTDKKITSDQKNNLEVLVNAVFWASKSINTQYVLSRLQDFHEEAHIKQLVQQCSKLIEYPDQIKKVKTLLNTGLKKSFEVFDAGSTIAGALERIFEKATSDTHTDYVLTGVPELDNRRLYPGRKGLHLFMAVSGEGKSWWLVHMGKQSLLQNLKVLHITTEISREELEERYAQSLFAVAAAEPDQTVRGVLRGVQVDVQNFGAPAHLMDPQTVINLIDKVKKLPWIENNLRMKEFPSNELTMEMLEAYIDSLEITQNFVPDVIVLDYPDQMALDHKNLQASTSVLYKRLKGLATKRNVFVIVATQSNRAGWSVGKDKKTKMGAEHMGQDISKYQIADMVVTFWRSPEEKQIGLGHIYQAKGRTARDGIEVLIEQDYQTGQFVRNSTLMTSEMGKELERFFKQADAAVEGTP